MKYIWLAAITLASGANAFVTPTMPNARREATRILQAAAQVKHPLPLYVYGC